MIADSFITGGRRKAASGLRSEWQESKERQACPQPHPVHYVIPPFVPESQLGVHSSLANKTSPYAFVI